jgi:outer membrane lipoprotein-sorting protein
LKKETKNFVILFKMKKIFAIILIVYAAALSAQTSDNAAKNTVNKAVAKLQNGALQSEIKITVSTQNGQKSVQKGVLKLAGNKFYLKTDDFKIFFDGKTQWVYMEQLNEVTLSEPNKEELELVSPIFIIKNFDKKHRVLFDSNTPNDNFWHINLFPIDKKNCDYFKIILTINKKSSEVKQIEIWQKNGEKLAVTFDSYTALSPENKTFTFSTKDYPKVIINDMR